MPRPPSITCLAAESRNSAVYFRSDPVFICSLHKVKVTDLVASTFRGPVHFDSPYTRIPPKISILSALTVPNGGDTMWCNQYESYDRLSSCMKDTLAGLRVRFVGLRLGRMM
ncbi:MAG: TauD/TfdA dioxygenase family protein, partial [Rhodoferax sp.]